MNKPASGDCTWWLILPRLHTAMMMMMMMMTTRAPMMIMMLLLLLLLMMTEYSFYSLWLFLTGQPVTVQHDETDEIITSFIDRKLVRYLRVFTVTTPQASLYTSTVLTSRFFVPQRLGGRQFETMTQTMHRINSWLALVGEWFHFHFQAS